MKNYLYVSDLDGTLLNSKSEISAYSLGVLNRLIDSGFNFTYATARSLHSASKVTKGLRLSGPVVVYNGACIVDSSNGKVLHASTFTIEEREYIQDLFGKNQLSPLVYSLVDGIEKVFWYPEKENQAIKAYLRSRGNDPRFNPRQAHEPIFTGEIFYYTLIGTDQELRLAYETLKDDSNYLCSYKKELYSDEYWLEIMPKAATKAQAISRLQTIWQFEGVVAFGDEINDIEMFKKANRALAVANAVDSLKEFADDTISSNDQDGVARWLEQNVLAHLQ